MLRLIIRRLALGLLVAFTVMTLAFLLTRLSGDLAISIAGPQATQADVEIVRKAELRMYLGSWGSYSINDVSAILPNFFDGGADDYARDLDVQKWLTEAGSSNDAEVRKKAYSAAIQRITERAYWAPLHTYVTTYGYSKQLDFTPYPDELPRFFLARWT